MLFTKGATQHTHIFYDLPQAADHLGMSETVLVRLSQYFKIPTLAYEEEGYLSFKGELHFSEPDLRFFKMVRERLVSGSTLPQVKQEIETTSSIFPTPLLNTTQSEIPSPLQAIPLQYPDHPQPIEPITETLPAGSSSPLTVQEQAQPQDQRQESMPPVRFAHEKQPPLLGMPKAFQPENFQTPPPRPAFQRQALPQRTDLPTQQDIELQAIQTGFPTPQVSNHNILKSMIYSQQQQQPQNNGIPPVNSQRDSSQYQPTYDKAAYVTKPGHPGSTYSRWNRSVSSVPKGANVNQSSIYQTEQVLQESFQAFGQAFGNSSDSENPIVTNSVSSNSLFHRFGTPPEPVIPQAPAGKTTPGISYDLRETLAANRKS